MYPSLVTLLILLMILCILFSLGSGLYYLVKDGGRTRRTVRALTTRIILSFILFIALLMAFAFGWITPHDLTSAPIAPIGSIVKHGQMSPGLTGH